MINGGYILQPRKIDESAISGSPPHVREIWFYLLRKANHKDKKIAGKTIKRGQVITSYQQIISDLSWKVGYRTERYKKHHCEIAMKALTKETMIATTKTTRGMVVTICNYDYYQSPQNYETDSETDNGNDNETTMKRHDKQELKELKNEKNIIRAKKFKIFGHVSSFFDPKFYDEKKWLDCYDKLIRIDGYTEQEILEIVKEFRSERNWWRDSANFESLTKLRKKDKNGIKYIDRFSKQLKNQVNGKNRKVNGQTATEARIAENLEDLKRRIAASETAGY